MKRKFVQNDQEVETYRFKKPRVPRPITKIDKNLLKRVRKIEAEQELKYSETYLTYTTIPWEGATPFWLIGCLNTSTSGPGQVNQRVGTKTANKRLDMRIVFRQQPGNVYDDRIRMCILWFKNSNGASPTLPTLFDQSLVAGGTYNFFNDQYKESYKVIHDETFDMKPIAWDGNPAGICIGDVLSINRSIKLNRTSRFVTGAGAGTYVDVLDNALYIVFMTSTQFNATNAQVLFQSRCWYYDD